MLKGAEMDVKEALSLITKVTGDFRGTRADHVLLNEALKVISVSVDNGGACVAPPESIEEQEN
jgi:hypothetical protein